MHCLKDYLLFNKTFEPSVAALLYIVVCGNFAKFFQLLMIYCESMQRKWHATAGCSAQFAAQNKSHN